ncbi:Holliday junction resolvase RuvX [Mycoplasmopsis adleri]|uniref:Holliday junction resolvase RuvX n=1 Tax=Mycoplasmopsis adleri TaxID=51362 RepID=UPI003872F75F
MRKLGLDLGTKTCGLAITDADAIIASPLETIRFEENDFQKLIEEIEKLQKEYSNSIDALVLGYPLRSNGTKSERTLMVEEVADLLHEHFLDLSIYFTEEYGTTIMAERILKSANLSNKKTRKAKDTLSAVIILNEFLNNGGQKIW